jgi:Second Messenger Oligonucleotide or Dinucleotide Synthetase domain
MPGGAGRSPDKRINEQEDQVTLSSFGAPSASRVGSAVYPLNSQFRSALSMIEINGKKRERAIKAHEEIRALLESDSTLCGWGVDTVLIGSYARHTGIWPGKDVDVFTKLTAVSAADVDPKTIYDNLLRVLLEKYGDRVDPQPRSVKVSFNTSGDEFSIDAVPAVRFGQRWAIPRRDRDVWGDPHERWVETDPEELHRLTEQCNRLLLVDGKGGYVPVVKLVRQTRSEHLGKRKPGGFYFELLTYWAFVNGQAFGSTYAEVFASTLAAVAAQLSTGTTVTDPVLGGAYRPAPAPEDVVAAATVFSGLASDAAQALKSDECPAAAIWRRVLGSNDQGYCFPLPDGCDAEGRALKVTAVGASRGPREAGGFA